MEYSSNNFSVLGSESPAAAASLPRPGPKAALAGRDLTALYREGLEMVN